MALPRVHFIEAWLWRRGFSIQPIRLIMHNLLVLTVLSAFLGICALPVTQGPITFAVGSLVFANVFWGIARHILGLTLTAYSMGLLLFMLLGTAFRLLVTAIVLYVVLVVYNASAIALVGGLIVSLAVALGTFALITFAGHKQ